MPKHLSLIALTAFALTAIPFAASASIFGTNLIVNGDAETPPSPFGSPPWVVPGFTAVGNIQTELYNAPGGFPSTGDAGVDVGGLRFFAGGPSNAASSAYQFIDLSSGASIIDLGATSYDLSAYLGGFASQRDNAVLSISFLDSLNAVIGTGSIGGVSNTDRGDATGLLFREASGLVPVGTRQVKVLLSMTRVDGDYNDGYADNLSLILDGKAPGGVPEPATWALMITGFGGVGLALRRRRQIHASA